MPRLKLLDSAVRNLGDITNYLEVEIGDRQAAERFTNEIIGKCENLARLTALVGRARQELLPGLHSFPFGSYIIFFRYLPSDTDRKVFEVVNILEGHRDFPTLFGSGSEE